MVAVGDAISAVPGVKRALAQPCRINSAAVQNDIERALFMSTDMYIYIYYIQSINQVFSSAAQPRSNTNCTHSNKTQKIEIYAYLNVIIYTQQKHV